MERYLSIGVELNLLSLPWKNSWAYKMSSESNFLFFCGLKEASSFPSIVINGSLFFFNSKIPRGQWAHFVLKFVKVSI